ncbi:MAG: hypothetical protein KAT00_09130, partial [Planctomycetes bacterium]|nr:hypothetical protein [Planctomycetota bacterium]
GGCLPCTVSFALAYAGKLFDALAADVGVSYVEAGGLFGGEKGRCSHKENNCQQTRAADVAVLAGWI